MSKKHISADLVERILAGDVPLNEFVRQVREHLMEICPECREALVRPPQPGSEETGKEVSLARIREAMRRNKLPALFERYSRVEVEDTAAHLLTESHNSTENPDEHLDWARAAYEALVASGSENQSLFALSFAFQGNAYRLKGDMREAFKWLSKAENAAATCTALDAKATVGGILGSYYMDLRKLDRAAIVLLEAATMAGENEFIKARILLKLGLVYEVAGDLDKSASAVREALSIIDEKELPTLYLYGRHNLALLLVTMGEFRAAQDILDYDEDMWRQVTEERMTVREWWLKSRIMAGLGDLRKAEKGFLGVRERFIARGEGFETALVTLDLALLYLAEGRIAEIVPMAEEMLQIFIACEVHPEAHAALLVLKQSLERTEVTREMIEKCYRYLREESSTPRSRQQESN